MANQQIEAAEEEIRKAINDALSTVQGLSGRAAVQIVDEYAPRFARLAVMDPADAKLEYDDLMTNLKLDQAVIAIEAQTAGVGVVMAILRTAAGLARSFVLPATGNPTA